MDEQRKNLQQKESVTWIKCAHHVPVLISNAPVRNSLAQGLWEAKVDGKRVRRILGLRKR